jgi:putative ABC transport system substrate-binding protein
MMKRASSSRSSAARRLGRSRRARSSLSGFGASAFWPVRTTRSYLAALREGLAKLGWIEGRNLRIDLRFTGSDPDRMRAYAQELVSLAPDVIVASSAPATRVVQQQTQTIPIVFTAGNDPVTNNLLQNIARPEGNTTGFAGTVDSLSGKWLELLKEAAPHITRVALVFDPQVA